MLRSATVRILRAPATCRAASTSRFVRIVEVGPRDGLQNEKTVVSPDVKVELINRLQAAGLPTIEAGSFVSPKWVPQMAGTDDILRRITHSSATKYPVLVPNSKGLTNLLDLLKSSPTPLTDEIAVFTAPSESFSKANTNCTVAESLERLSHVVQVAQDNGLRVRGYVSTVITCPYEGRIEPHAVREVAKALLDMGCYEVSLGDTTGAGTPQTILEMLNAVQQHVDASKLAAHWHDTCGTAIANVMAALSAGIRVVDSSVAGLGGCPYSPGATGNVATEDVVHVLHGDGWETGVDMSKLAATGDWISRELGRPNESRAGRAWLAKRARESATPPGPRARL
ncbi:aldolase [Exidia glandulosa HHB12029]|uniref:hydroxymethylglutaryl-CoA lyase n=1 Tax=Exidia glandulosa HHB12029 TaxID=1314781 RepID=A0A166BEL4_EXIGL|nr:aldolase [Exidia glandulosa HHB12029]